jgi:hypothetical protein
MTGWQPILLAARRSLIALAVVALLCVSAVVALHLLASALNTEVVQLGGAVQQQRDQINLKREDLRNVRSHIARFERLRTQGLLGTPDRPLWVEELLASHSRLGLPGPLVYQLQIPKTVTDANAQSPANAPPAAPEGTGEDPLVHDLQFELRDVHEGDVLRLIQDFRAHVKGRFRVNACTFAEPRENGMLAQCVLRFVTVPPVVEAKPPS